MGLYEIGIFVYFYDMSSEGVSRWIETLQPGTVRDLFECLPNMMYFAKDSHLRLMAGNRAFVHHCGFNDESELIGKTDHEIFPPQMAEKFAQDDRQILESGKAMNDMVELFPNEMGIPGWYTTDKIPLFTRSGEIAGLCGLVRSYQVEGDEQLKSVTESLMGNFAKTTSMSAIAKGAGFSMRQMERRFQEAYKTTPIQYVMRLRVLRACEMLTTSHKPVTSIALEVGFYDHSAFSRKFSALIGESPSAYRNRYQRKKLGGDRPG